MDSLYRHGVPGIPRVIPSVADETAVALRLPGHREDRCCMVHEWVPGSQLAGQAGPEDFRSVGMLTASIHEHGVAFRPPPGFALPAIDLASYVNPDGAEGEQARTVLSPESLSLFRTAYARVTAAWERAERREPGRRLIHNDMHMANLIVCGDKIGLVDFEQAGWGHPAQDIASTFYYEQSSPLYEQLWTAFREGYTTRRPWPEEEERCDVNAFIAAMCVEEALNTCEFCSDEGERARRVEAAEQRVWRLLFGGQDPSRRQRTG
jgi:Ser/Thr protein kinase RdoA (MazF antagonist)